MVSGRRAVVPARLPEAIILALARTQEVGRSGPARRRPGDGEECCGDSACDSMDGIVVLGGDSGFRAPTGLESTEGLEVAGIAGSKQLRRFGVIQVVLWRDARRSGMLDDAKEHRLELQLGCVPPRLLDSGPWHAGWLHDGDSHGGPPIGYHSLWAHGALSHLRRSPLTEACIILSLPCVKPRCSDHSSFAESDAPPNFFCEKAPTRAPAGRLGISSGSCSPALECTVAVLCSC